MKRRRELEEKGGSDKNCREQIFCGGVMRRTRSARARKRDLAGSMRAPVFSWGFGVSQASFQIPDSGGKELQRNSLEAHDLKEGRKTLHLKTGIGGWAGLDRKINHSLLEGLEPADGPGHASEGDSRESSSRSSGGVRLGDSNSKKQSSPQISFLNNFLL
ncbi:hypothetical protein CEXT_544211 [Caerostris extrusa]|uniref:Uncharacterized protein n=1 Tax=Caerostris extrusa TaxID=172846 RepID=A0AAV4WW00_CAEEX|nr:hypothetical protein CEXT_544211 [Caerostris extrusa]